MTIGRFQSFAQGYLNIVNEDDISCIVHRNINK